MTIPAVADDADCQESPVCIVANAARLGLGVGVVAGGLLGTLSIFFVVGTVVGMVIGGVLGLTLGAGCGVVLSAGRAGLTTPARASAVSAAAAGVGAVPVGLLTHDVVPLVGSLALWVYVLALAALCAQLGALFGPAVVFIGDEA